MGIKRDFADEYAGKVGTIEGGDGTPVTLNMIGLSTFCIPERAAEFGCPPNTLGILCEWLPAGLTHDKDGPDDAGFPNETGTDPSKISDKSTWVIFPKTFEGTPVYYKRGSAIWAL